MPFRLRSVLAALAVRVACSALAVGVACAVSACSSCGKPSAPSGPAVTDGAAAVEPPVPPPDGLVAEGWVRTPNALWGRIQRGMGGAAALLPPDVGGVVCAVLGLDTQLAPLLDGPGPAAYVVLADEPGGAGAGFGWAVALPLFDGTRAASILLDGDAARYAAHDMAGQPSMRVLSRLDRPLEVAVALVRSAGALSWLVVARDDADLARLGPYAWRTMPTRPAPASMASVVAVASRAALAGVVAPRLASQWTQLRAWLSARDQEERARHGGRAPDFGDPQAILDAVGVVVKRRVALVAGARSAHLELDVGDDDVHAEVRIEPAAGDAGADSVAAMVRGDARPLAEAPGDAVLGVLFRDDASGRSADAREMQAAIVRALGPRVHDDDARAVGSALDDWAAGRGDWLTASVGWGGSLGVWLRTPAGDAGAGAVRAVREVVDLTRRPPFADPLQHALGVGPPTFQSTSVDGGLGEAVLAAFPASSGTPLGVAWGLQPHGGDLLVAVGPNAPARLGTLAAPPTHLGDDPHVARALSALGTSASFVMIAQPLKLDPARAATDAARAPVVLAWGRRDADAWLRVDVADELVRELVRMQGGFGPGP